MFSQHYVNGLNTNSRLKKNLTTSEVLVNIVKISNSSNSTLRLGGI